MSSSGSRPPTDYRRYHRETERRLVIAVIVVLVLVGSALITLIFGAGAGLTGLTCLLFGAAAIGGLWLLLSLIERWLGD
jgi:hypothetical protein